MTTPNDSDLPFDSVDRYLRGEPTPADERTIEAWARQHPTAHRTWLDLRAALRDESSVDGAERAVQQLRHRIAEFEARGANAISFTPIDGVMTPTRASAGRPPMPGRLGGWPARRWLAAGLSAMGVAAALLYGGARLRTAPNEPIVYDRTYVARTMQVAQITLDDGTRIALAPNSTLRVGRQGSAARVTARHVILDGEAVFDVRSAAEKPFIVHAGATAIRVLGTRFDVRRDGKTVRVVVTSGRVSLMGGPRAGSAQAGNAQAGNAQAGDAQSVVLAAGMMGVVTDSSLTATNVTDAKDYTAWVDGELVFREIPVSQVLATLERWYGYRFRVSDSTLARRKLTAHFGSESNADMLKALGTLLDVTLTFDDSNTVVTLRPRSSSRSTPKTDATHDPIVHSKLEVGR